jgi:hypothetical protein
MDKNTEQILANAEFLSSKLLSETGDYNETFKTLLDMIHILLNDEESKKIDEKERAVMICELQLSIFVLGEFSILSTEE